MASMTSIRIYDAATDGSGFKAEAAMIQAHVEAGLLCRRENHLESIQPDFVADSVRSAKLIMSLYETTGKGRSEQLKGFALFYPSGNGKSLYLDLICCQSGYGGKLIKEIFPTAKSMGFASVSLSALVGVIHYYRQFGFIQGTVQTKREDPAVTRLAEACKGMSLINDKTRTPNMPFYRFLERLVDEDLASDPACTNVGICSESGFKMIKWLDHEPVAARAPKPDITAATKQTTTKTKKKPSTSRKKQSSTSRKKQSSTSRKKQTTTADKVQDKSKQTSKQREAATPLEPLSASRVLRSRTIKY